MEHNEIYYCENCGRKLPVIFRFCNICGYDMAMPEKPETAPALPAAPYGMTSAGTGANNQASLYHASSYQEKYGGAPQLSGGAKAWLIICLVVNAILGVLMLVTAANAYEPSTFYLSAFLCLAVVTGYSILLARKKAGFYIILCFAIVNIIANVITGNYTQIGFGILNPIITWLLVKNLWEK